MKHVTQGDLGQPITAVHSPDAPCDKWAILNDLTTAAEDFELSHRTLGVLKALLSFLPSRIIGTDRRGNTVFPANRTLSHRLNGMPESTLRRHLARLVELGIVSRRDSANRKRFARNMGQAGEMAFGFDLTPLATLATQIRAQAAEATARANALHALRDEVAALRQVVLDLSGPSALTETARKTLRRKPVHAILTQLRDSLHHQIADLETPQMAGTDNQNERHIQVKPKSNSEGETTPPQKKEPADNHVSLAQVIQAFDAYKDFFPTPVRNWHDLHRISESLAPMIGIEPPVYREAKHRMGAGQTSIAVLFILENLKLIDNPGGYIRRITQNACSGGENTALALVSRPKLSADNRNNQTKSVSYRNAGAVKCAATGNP